MVGEKPLPRISTLADVKALCPPDFKYEYLLNAEDHPFCPQAGGFEPANAWWLNELAFLAYVNDPAFIEDAVKKARLDLGLAFFGFDNPIHKSTECLLVHNDAFIVVAFRGTLMDSPSDVLTDLWAIPRHIGRRKEVHWGFNRAVDEVWDRISAYLRRLRKTQTVWFTGHSLGAALATIAAQRFAEDVGPVQGLYTFGSPRVGNEAFAREFAVPAYRVVNDKDVVCRVPPRRVRLGRSLGVELYRHVGEPWYFDNKGALHQQEPPAHRRPWTTLREILRQGRQQDKNGAFLKALIDHAPKIYAIRLWNTYVQSLAR